MPSPIGHALAGLTVALAADQREQLTRRWTRLMAICACLAAAPDLDLLYRGSHRGMTHSLFATAVVFVASIAVTRSVARRVDWQASVACALAYGSHLLADYFSVDYGAKAGIQLLWPWGGAFMSPWSIFRATERYAPFSSFAITMNTLALAQEILVIGPILTLVWLRRRRLTREVGPLSQPSRVRSQDSRPGRDVPESLA